MHEEGLSRDALVALEVLQDEIARVRRLHMTTRLTGDEYLEKILLLTGGHPDAVEYSPARLPRVDSPTILKLTCSSGKPFDLFENGLVNGFPGII
jgi:hypothetical protein